MDALERALQEAGATHLDRLLARVYARLDGRERRVLDWLWDRYRDERQRRWYDPYHVLFSADFALALTLAEGVDRLIVTGALLHDVGYCALEDKAQWSRPESRITHMAEGAALAAGVACRTGFSADEVEALVGMIAVHDNPYIGLPIRGAVRLALRDSDRAFVMHLLSFYNDWNHKRAIYPEPDQFLRDRLIQFCGREAPFGGVWTVTEDDLVRNAGGLERPVHALTRTLAERQFARRIEELEGEALWRDPGRLLAYATGQLDSEFFLDG